MESRIKIRGAAIAALIAASLAAGAGPAAAAAPTGDAAAPLYDPGRIDVIKLDLPPESIANLEADPEGEYQPGTFSLAETAGTPGGVGAFSAPLQVGIRLKGGVGSFRVLGDKAGFKIKFAKTAPFLGLKKMTLNNMVQDPSMIHETLAYEAFGAAGVPAPRTGFADVVVNGEDYGVHLNVETLDKVALEKRFGTFAEPPQHLYEGEYGADATADRVGLFEVDEGKATDQSDLAALVAASEDGSAPDWSDSVAPFADLGEMTHMWAVEKYIGHWDGYSGEESDVLPNNFYLYSDAGGRFQMLPWGTDLTWEEHLPFDGAAGALFDACLADASCEALYRSAAADALGSIAALDLDTTARCTAELLRPWQELEPPQMDPPSAAEVDAAVQTARQFIASRGQELAAWLGVSAPPPSGLAPPCRSASTPVVPASDPVVSTAGPGTSAPAPAATPGSVALQLLRVKVAGDVLRSRVATGAAGTISQRATIATRDGIVTVCRADAAADGAEEITLSCPLSPAILDRLRARWLRVSLLTRFTAPGASSEVLTRRLTLPRLG